MPTVGTLLINDILPPEYRDNNRVLDKKGLKKLLTDVANKDPEKYQEILGKLGRLGAQFAQRSGGYSLATDLLQTPELTKAYRKRIQAQLKAIYNDDSLTTKQKDERVMDVTVSTTEKLREELYEHLTENESPIALMARSGAKGNAFNISAGVGFDGLYVGSSEKPVPFPVLNNYSAGLNPFEYWAGSFGARKGVVETKTATADGGFLCLCKGTLVRMADFSTKKIEDIQVGDYVLGVDDSLCGMPVKVVNTFDNGLRECWRTHFIVGIRATASIYLESTLDHKVFGIVGGAPYTPDAYPIGCEENFTALPLKNSLDSYYKNGSLLLGKRQTYDIEVASDNHLFVLANGLIVSNSKQITQVMHKGVISADDHPENKFKLNVGLPSETDDSDNIGRFLAHDIGGYKRNTLITDGVLKDLQRQKIKDILVRSPMVGGPNDGSLYAKDVGMGERGRLYVLGENPSITAGQAISEPISQSILSGKHTGGVFGATAKGKTGFKAINQMLQVPGHWEGAEHAQEDGKVTSIRADEIGNQVVTINGKEHNGAVRRSTTAGIYTPDNFLKEFPFLDIEKPDEIHQFVYMPLNR